MSGQNGKGDSPRPKSISNEQFQNNWNNIFKKNKKINTTKHDRIIKNNKEI